MRHPATALPPLMPEQVFKLSLRANHDCPQSNLASRLYVGSAVTQLVLDGEYSWPDLFSAEPSDEQLEVAAERVKDAHRVGSINAQLDANPAASHKPGQSHATGLFDVKRLRSTVTSDAGTALLANAKYAYGMYVPALYRPGLEARNALTGVSIDNDNSSLLEGLFKRNQIRGRRRPLRPEQVALVGLWQNIDGTLKQMQGDMFPAHRQELTRIMRIPGPYMRETLLSMTRAEIDQAIALRIGNGLKRDRERIGQEAGVHIPGGVLEYFTRTKF